MSELENILSANAPKVEPREETDAERQEKVYAVAKGIKDEDLKYFLESMCNSFSRDFHQGKRVGKLLQNSHRTLQASVLRYLLGIVVGIGEDVHTMQTDARNARAVACAQDISKLIERGVLDIGYMI